MIEVARVRATLKRTPRFVARVFTPAERDYCDSRGAVAPQHYAARFAAKEAALKALGTGWSGGVAWQDVEITRGDAGAPAIVFHRRALELFQLSGATRAHLSLSHTSEHAIAQVILERSDD
ncbi:MAG: holo-[acyl-carrier protein] synthase [Acidobacteriota bacterium]|nr:holo-[acyl-carrier protein] synthase [Acidobacteriota bacterium]